MRQEIIAVGKSRIIVQHLTLEGEVITLRYRLPYCSLCERKKPFHEGEIIFKTGRCRDCIDRESEKEIK